MNTQVTFRSSESVEKLKIFLVGHNSLRAKMTDLLFNAERFEISGESHCADMALSEITRLQPQVVVHSVHTTEGDSASLAMNVKKRLPATCYITLGNLSDFSYRIKYRAVGATHILDQRGGLGEVSNILVTYVLSKSKGHENLGRYLEMPKVPATITTNTQPLNKIHPLLFNASPSSLDLVKLFSKMDNSPANLMFADRGLTLRHINPVALHTLKEIESFLPRKTDDLTGQPIYTFHKLPGIIRKIFSNTKNLPYRARITIGPKILDMEVSAVYNDDNSHFLGIMTCWTEISEVSESVPA